MGTAHDHGPSIFNMDASGGIPAAITEMLLQSHGGIADCRLPNDDEGTSLVSTEQSAILNPKSTILLRLLPALPPAWPKGRVTGLLARGGIIADIEWDGGALRRVTLRAGRDARLRVRYQEREVAIHLAAGEAGRMGPALDMERETG
jgi:hypothetical protein